MGVTSDSDVVSFVWVFVGGEYVYQRCMGENPEPV